MTLASQIDRAAGAKYDLGGWLESYLRGVSDNWLKTAPLANPAMLEMFRDRNRKPLRNLMPWAGEFAGKYLTGAVQVLRLTGDPELRALLTDFVAQLVACQAENGYLGPWPTDRELTGRAFNWDHEGETWDTWGHYHAMIGLLLWHEDTGDKKALKCASRIGDLLCNTFLGTGKRMVDIGCTEMNLAPAHSLCLLYRRTGDERHLKLARQIAEEFAAVDAEGKPLAGDYLRGPLAGKEFFELPRPRWESLHPIMGLVELYYLTGEEHYRQAFEKNWWSIVKLDRHNNGGFSSGEKAQGNPYHGGAIETCCTIAWMAMSVEMLRLTGNSVVADELELSLLNSVSGMHSYTGRWVTYNTPMDGLRKSSQQDIVFQSREGSPELNCCSVNGARGFGLLSEWALMRDADGLLLNYYGEGEMSAEVKKGLTVRLRQTTDYPRSGRVEIAVSPSRAAEFDLKLRIPHWSAKTTVKVNGKAVAGATPGRYLSLNRKWKRGDKVTLDLDFSLRFWKGEKECEGKASMFRGPILLTYDRRFNDMDPDAIPALDAAGLKGRIVAWKGTIPPILLMEFPAEGGRKLRLCDFGSAGQGGTPYVSWLKIAHSPAAEYSPANPLRTAR